MIEDDRDKAIMECVEGIPNSSFHLNSSLITWGMRGRGHLIKIKKNTETLFGRHWPRDLRSGRRGNNYSWKWTIHFQISFAH